MRIHLRLVMSAVIALLTAVNAAITTVLALR